MPKMIPDQTLKPSKNPVMVETNKFTGSTISEMHLQKSNQDF